MYIAEYNIFYSHTKRSENSQLAAKFFIMINRFIELFKIEWKRLGLNKTWPYFTPFALLLPFYIYYELLGL